MDPKKGNLYPKLQTNSNRSEPNSISCAACGQLPLEVVESACCSSIFCWECVLKIGKCPACNSILSGETCIPNVPLRKLINSMEKKCKYEDCHEVLKGHLLSVHEASCPYKPVVCPNSDLCGILHTKDLQKHQTDDCLYRLIECPSNCGTAGIQFMNLEKHLKSDCTELMVDCPNGCELTAKRSTLKQHLSNDCPLENIKCEFAEYGCLHASMRISYNDHLEKEHKSHVIMLANAVKAQNQQIKDLQSKIDTLTKQNENCPCNFFSPDTQTCNQMKQIAAQVKETVVLAKNQVKEKLPQLTAGLTPVHALLFVMLWGIFNHLPFLLPLMILLFVGFKSCHSYKCARLQNRNNNDNNNSCNFKKNKIHLIIGLAALCSLIHPIALLMHFKGHHHCHYAHW